MKTHPLIKRISTASLLGSIALGSLQTAHAALLAYESFDYAVGSNIVGQNGGIGFSGAWREFAAGSVPAGSFTVVSGSLAAPGLPTSGNSALATGQGGTMQAARSFSEIAGTDGTSLWVSFIGQRLGPPQDPATLPDNPYPRGVNISLFDTTHATRPERVGLGNSSNAAQNVWSIIPEGSGNLRAGSTVPFTTQTWAVMRIDYHGDSSVGDDYRLWLNPDPSIDPSATLAAATIMGGVDASNLDFLRPFVGNTNGASPYGVLAFDELRIGTTYADMSAVPEPSVAVLGGLGLLGVFRRRR